MATIIKQGHTDPADGDRWWLHETWRCEYCGCEFVPEASDQVEIVGSDGLGLRAARMYCPWCGVMASITARVPRDGQP